MPAQAASRRDTKTIIDEAIRRAIRRRYDAPDRRFVDLLAAVRGRSDLLRPARFRGRIDSG